jgi:hypothetical protein
VAEGTADQVSLAPRSRASALTAGAAVGAPAQPLLTGAGVAHAMPWRL